MNITEYNPNNEPEPSFITEFKVKQIRNELLKFVDRVNPIWYSTLTDAQISELKTYRQSLLDITLQTGYPTDIYWPEKPNWL